MNRPGCTARQLVDVPRHGGRESLAKYIGEIQYFMRLSCPLMWCFMQYHGKTPQHAFFVSVRMMSSEVPYLCCCVLAKE